MSGGSYDYLCFADSSDALTDKVEYNLANMAQRLAGLGWADDAARESTELLLLIRQAQVNLGVRMDRLRDIWKAVEWWDSMDSGEDGVREALVQYRAPLEVVGHD